MYAGNIGLSLPVALYNIRQSYREVDQIAMSLIQPMFLQGTGKNRTFLESLRPLVSTSVAMVISFVWVIHSPNNILERDPRMVFYLTGN